jgi:hypothetical protein
MKARKKLLLIAAQPDPAVIPNISTATLIAVSDLSSDPYAGNRQERSRLREEFGSQPEINTAPYVTLSATMPLSGSGAAGTAPNFGLALRACGLRELIEATKVTYAPATNNHETVTVWFVEDGQVQVMPGCKGTAEFDFTAQAFPVMNLSLTGLYQRPVAHTAALAQTLSNFAGEIPVNKQNTPTFTVHGFAGCGQSLKMTLGNEVVHRNMIGCESIKITDRKSTGSVEIEAPDIATKNYFQNLESHATITEQPVTMVHGTAAGNIIEFSAPKVQLSSLSRSEVNGMTHYTMNMILNPTTGDDEFELIFR